VANLIDGDQSSSPDAVYGLTGAKVLTTSSAASQRTERVVMDTEAAGGHQLLLFLFLSLVLFAFLADLLYQDTVRVLV